MTQPTGARPSIQTPTRPLQVIGSVGSALALTILGASILLRLTTVFGGDGQPISTLPPAIESAVRLLHRLAASGVGLLALSAAILCWRRRPWVANAVMPTAWIVSATVLLAVIGPLTPGYRFAAVTVANVVGGTLLLMACWWLRESLGYWGQTPISQRCEAPPPEGEPKVRRIWALTPKTQRSHDPLLIPALIVFLVHVGSGAAASALEMRGIGWVAFIHMGSAVLVFLFVGAILWDRHGRERLTRLVGAMTLLLVAQIALGLALIAMDARPTWLEFLHAMLSPLLAAGLVSIAVRDSGGERPAGSRAPQ